MEEQADAVAAPSQQAHSHETRDWAALPRDVVLEILGRLRHTDILRGAGLACAEWRRAAVDEPTLWRHIDLHFLKSDAVNQQAYLVRLAMGRAAADRSAGLCESFHGVVDADLLVYLADRAPSLRSIVALVWCLPDEYLDRVITKLPMLEWIELGYSYVSKATLLGLIKHCPRLELLDAGECTTDAAAAISYSCICFQKTISCRLHSRFKFIDFPRTTIPGRCLCLKCCSARMLPEDKENNINN